MLNAKRQMPNANAKRQMPNAKPNAFLDIAQIHQFGTVFFLQTRQGRHGMHLLLISLLQTLKLLECRICAK